MKMQTDRTMDRRTEGWTEEWKDRRTNRPYFIGPFQLLPGSKKLTTYIYFAFVGVFSFSGPGIL